MHQTMGEFTVRGKDQEPGGGDVEPADRYPAGSLQPRQSAKDGAPPRGIGAGGDLPFGLVVEHMTVPGPTGPQRQPPTVQVNRLVARE